jgi:pimeloyl-ACP methyl ester carboxylesterase
LLIVGENDRIVDPHQAYDAGQQLPNGTVVMLRNCGHAPQIEMSHRINSMVTRFLLQSEDSNIVDRHYPEFATN